MKALFIGLGSIGQRHLRNFLMLSDSNKKVIALRSTGTNNILINGSSLPCKNLAEHYDLTEYVELNDVLEQNPDVGFVCNPSKLHLEYACELAEKGISLFIEKPLATDTILLDKLEKIISKKELTTLVGFQSRFNPCIKETKRILRKQEFGRVISGDFMWCTYLPDHHPYEDYRDSYAAREDLGGGVTFSLCHELDLIQYLFGLPKTVYALEGGKSNLGINVEDTVTALFSCLEETRTFPVSLRLSFAQGLEKRRFEILMENGLLECDLQKNCITVLNQKKQIIFEKEFKQLKRNDLFLYEMEHFLNSVSMRKDTLIPVAEGKKSLIMALGIHNSLKKAKIVELYL